MKKFIITIDTEGDNLWTWKEKEPITTENTKFLNRFQKLCDEYGFKPTWLTNYEMIDDARYVEFISKVASDFRGEIGMHLHAWSTPPEYTLCKMYENAPYLIEYPTEIMEEKVSVLTDTIFSRTGIRPISHRAGRWAMNDLYFEVLNKYGYKVDCSITPHIDWSSHLGQSENSKGSDYRAYPEGPYKYHGIIEVPMTVRKTHHFIQSKKNKRFPLMYDLYHAIKGQTLWFRPNTNNIEELKWIANSVLKGKSDYLMFMLHSSEFMPGGSPTFLTVESIDQLFNNLNCLFHHISKDYEGVTLSQFANSLSL